MCRDRRRHYDDGFMRVVADLIRGGAGRRSLARRLGVPVSTAGKWVLSYRFGGEAALMGEREGNRRYDYETKLAAVRDHVEHGLTKAEVMEKYRIAGPACLCSISCCGFSHDDFSGLGRACRPRNGLNWMVLVSPPERTGKDYDQHAPSTVYPSFAAERGIRRVDRAENTCRRSRRCVSTSRRRICRPCRR